MATFKADGYPDDPELCELLGKWNNENDEDWSDRLSPPRQLQKFGSFRLMSTAGTITGKHEDGSGTLTILDVIYGHKIWSLYDRLKSWAEHLVLVAGSRL